MEARHTAKSTMRRAVIHTMHTRNNNNCPKSS
jgi:hypothetical protein